LRCDPVLAVSTVEIASQHAEAVSQRARVSVEEGLFLDGIALYTANIAPRHIQRTAAVVAHLADAGLAVGDRATMAAGITADTVAVELFVQLSFADVLVNDVAEGRHNGTSRFHSKPEAGGLALHCATIPAGRDAG